MNIKRILTTASLCLVALLSGCGVSESGESENRSLRQAQSDLSVVSAPSTADSGFSSSTSSSSSSYSVPSPPSSASAQKQLGGTDNYGVFVEFIESHPNAVLVNVSDSEDTTNPEVYDRIGKELTIIRIPYAEFQQRISEIPSGRPVLVYGPATQAIFAYGRLTEYRTDIPEVMYFFWIPIQMSE